MTLPYERTRAVLSTKQLFLDILDNKPYTKTRKGLKEAVSACLRHYPWDSDMKQVIKKAPEIFGDLEK